jgi:small subunit ribosomal protein S3
MGQKVNPIAFRNNPELGNSSDSKYFSNNLSKDIIEDYKIRTFISDNYKQSQVSKVIIEKTGKNIFINIYARKPGVMIGKKGSDIDSMRNKILKLINSSGDIKINIHEVRNPDLDSRLVAQNVAFQLEKRVSFKRAMKLAMENAMRSGAKGIKISCSGRLAGAEIARTEWYRKGRVPLSTMRYDIDYGIARAETVYGTIGIKVWIYRAIRTFRQM